MKKLAWLLTMVLLICSCLSGCGGEHRRMIKDAIAELEDYWADIYDDIEDDRDIERYFEIKNTRVITLYRNDYEELKDIEYIIDFVVYTDYYGIEGYYVDARCSASGEGGAVAVYRNGDMEVVSNSLIIEPYTDVTGRKPTEEFIKSVDDYGDKYNCKKKLK